MKYITFDTSWLERIGYNFSFAAFKCIRYTDYKVIISDIVDREIKKHILKKSEVFVNSYNNAFKDAKFLSKVKKMPDPLNVSLIQKAALTSYELFKKDINACIIPLDKCNIKHVIDLYFKEIDVFANKHKKNEFPDAIAVDSISNYVGNDEIIVFSLDNDWKNHFSKNNKAVVYYETSDLIKIIKIEDLAAELIDDYKDEILDEFINHLNDSFEKYFSNIEILFPLDYCIEDLSIEDFELDFLEYEAIELISKSEKNITAAIHFKYKFALDISYDDFSNCCYDREDGMKYNVVRLYKNISGEEVGYCLIKFEFENNKFNKIISHKLLDVDFCYGEEKKYKVEQKPIEERDYHDSAY